MARILITGATGNVGKEVLQFLNTTDHQIIVGVRNVQRAKIETVDKNSISLTHFDFENEKTFKPAFEDVDRLFLLRPPHISEIKKYFDPLLSRAKESGIKQIVFLSVQGAEKSNIIPHNKIERLIKDYGFEYIFIRPGYFMQNLTTTLLHEIRAHRQITLPAGNAKFNWVDVKNIAEVTAIALSDFEKYSNKSIEITGSEQLNFEEVADIMSEVIREKITYRSVNPLKFFFLKKKEGMNTGFIIVIAILHFLPRIQKQPSLSKSYTDMTGKIPTTLKEFIEREIHSFTLSS